MTNTDTADTKASVSQCLKIIEAGADFVRLTAQGIKEAENFAVIKKEVRKAGYDTPLIADIHFNPAAAETAARIVEKIRINPGNYVDKRASFEVLELTEKEYNEELERIHARLLPLINICTENKTAIRVGINHGSLSDRIMTRYGNTPSGMVTSALEFIKIFRAENFNNLILSMKSSDTSVMIEATRMLVGKMQQEEMSYPLHLGVTEAGEGDDGRVRSAVGIGTLLSEGIGDTIRVSLSENPENEIPVAKKLVDYYPRGCAENKPIFEFKPPAKKPLPFRKINGPIVIATETNNDFGCTADFIMDKKKSIILSGENQTYPLFSCETFCENTLKSDELGFFLTDSRFSIQQLKKLDAEKTGVIFTFNPYNEKYALDAFIKTLADNNLSYNIVPNPVFDEKDEIETSALFGRFLNDKLIAGICITNTSLAFSILQNSETRITRTIYISCPTCGRTKFNLSEAVKKVKNATQHLKGLKIAIMGCIVNGPGEMAGADYGYVGAGAGKVHIYKGTDLIFKNVPEEDTIDKLLKLIEADAEN
jgi:(E)-4-hydroxy-3-methylbut-2-enyl-diphosphate synthase